jgi:hypothetical protein
MARQNRRPKMEMLGWCASVCKVRVYADKRHGMMWREGGGVDIDRRGLHEFLGPNVEMKNVYKWMHSSLTVAR